MISVDPMKETNISYILILEEEIDFNPLYQRESDIWPLSKKQLFIDSLINGMDIPKLYFHELKKTKSNKFKYAVVDGKQRLGAIFSFLKDGFSISEDFVDFSKEFNELAGKKYSEFSKISPKLKARFDAKQLPIYVIKTDDEDLIEEMFYRLNEAAPLNASEKRNSISGPFPRLTKDLSKHDFFVSKVAFSSKRFKHYDAISKLLIIIHSQRIVDTKKLHLDSFAKSIKSLSKNAISKLKNDLVEILDAWSRIFEDKDRLLKSPSALPVYLVVYRHLERIEKLDSFDVMKLRQFEDDRLNNKTIANNSEQSAEINFQWLEYDRLIQSPNDSSSIRFRANSILEYLGVEQIQERA